MLVAFRDARWRGEHDQYHHRSNPNSDSVHLLSGFKWYRCTPGRRKWSITRSRDGNASQPIHLPAEWEGVHP